MEPMCCQNCCQKDPIQSFFVVKGCQWIKAVTMVCVVSQFP